IIMTIMVSILKLGDIENMQPSWCLITFLFLGLFLFWGLIVYLILRGQARKMIEKELKERSKEKPAEEIISEKLETSQARSDNV
ncbi:MAG: hypothetical protein L0Y73_08520, partial [Candidatus Aminicenantes bacterium]|nr:hypothetical protein [Candidatus Aminicenantes bacterium]